MDKFLTLDEAAEIFGVEYKTVYRLVRSGQLPAGKIGRVYRLKRSDLDAFFESTKQKVAAGESIALKGLRCCITGKRIVSELDIGGYTADTGEPICQAAWDEGNRTLAGGHKNNHSNETGGAA